MKKRNAVSDDEINDWRRTGKAGGIEWLKFQKKKKRRQSEGFRKEDKNTKEPWKKKKTKRP